MNISSKNIHLVIAIFIFSSCSSNSNDESTFRPSQIPNNSGISPNASISDSDWWLISISNEQEAPALVFPPYTMSFRPNDFGTFSVGFSNCGGLEGESEISGNVITTMQVIDNTDEIECAGISSDNEVTNNSLKEIFLNTRTTFDIDGGILFITDTQNISAKFINPFSIVETDLDDFLSMISWRLVSVNTSDGNSLFIDESFRTNPPYTLGFVKSINGAGEVQRFVGGKVLCGAYTANYALESNVVSTTNTSLNIECEHEDTDILSIYEQVLLSQDSSLVVDADEDMLVFTSETNEQLVFARM